VPVTKKSAWHLLCKAHGSVVKIRVVFIAVVLIFTRGWPLPAVAELPKIDYAGSLSACDELLEKIVVWHFPDLAKEELIFSKLSDLDQFYARLGNETNFTNIATLKALLPTKNQTGFLVDPSGKRLINLIEEGSVYIFSTARPGIEIKSRPFQPLNHVFAERQRKIEFFQFKNLDSEMWIEEFKRQYPRQKVPESILYVENTSSIEALIQLAGHLSIDFLELWVQANQRLKKMNKKPDILFSAFTSETNVGLYVDPLFVDIYGNLKVRALATIFFSNAKALMPMLITTMNVMAEATHSTNDPEYREMKQKLEETQNKAGIAQEDLKTLIRDIDIDWDDMREGLAEKGLPTFTKFSDFENFVDGEMKMTVARARR